MAVVRAGTQQWNQDGGGASPITKAHTCAAGTTTLVVGFTDPSGGTVTAATYNGVAADILRNVAGGRKAAVAVFYNPDTSGAHDIVLTLSSSATDYAMFADDLTGVDQSVADVNNQSIASSNPVTVTLTPPGSAGIIYLLISAAWNGVTGSGGTGQVTIYHIDMGVDTLTATYELYSVAGVNNQTWSFSSIDPGYSALAVALQATTDFVPRVIGII